MESVFEKKCMCCYVCSQNPEGDQKEESRDSPCAENLWAFLLKTDSFPRSTLCYVLEHSSSRTVLLLRLLVCSTFTCSERTFWQREKRRETKRGRELISNFVSCSLFLEILLFFSPTRDTREERREIRMEKKRKKYVKNALTGSPFSLFSLLSTSISRRLVFRLFENRVQNEKRMADVSDVIATGPKLKGLPVSTSCQKWGEILWSNAHPISSENSLKERPCSRLTLDPKVWRILEPFVSLWPTSLSSERTGTTSSCLSLDAIAFPPPSLSGQILLLLMLSDACETRFPHSGFRDETGIIRISIFDDEEREVRWQRQYFVHVLRDDGQRDRR